MATKDPVLQKRFKHLMVEPKSTTPRETDAFFQEQLKFNEAFIARAKIPAIE
jgi:tripartite-type tricarboxylate transporter receptor subunit TctC